MKLYCTHESCRAHAVEELFHAMRVLPYRREEFVENLCRKLLAYALGRSLLPSDDDTISSMRSRLAADGYRFGSMVESIVTSPQFLNKRVDGEPERGRKP